MPQDRRAMLACGSEVVWTNGQLETGRWTFVDGVKQWRRDHWQAGYYLYLHSAPYAKNSCLYSLDDSNTPPAYIWFPGYADIRTHWHIHFNTVRQIRYMICRWRFHKPCSQVLKNKIIDIYMDDSFVVSLHAKYTSVYGKSGYKLRQLTQAAQNALTRFIIWMKRFTDSIWCTVPIEICRLIASHCRLYKL
jgi:hypothetical protein